MPADTASSLTIEVSWTSAGSPVCGGRAPIPSAMPSPPIRRSRHATSEVGDDQQHDPGDHPDDRDPGEGFDRAGVAVDEPIEKAPDRTADIGRGTMRLIRSVTMMPSASRTGDR